MATGKSYDELLQHDNNENLDTKWKIYKWATQLDTDANDNMYDCVTLQNTDVNDDINACVAPHDAHSTVHVH